MKEKMDFNEDDRKLMGVLFNLEKSNPIKMSIGYEENGKLQKKIVIHSASSGILKMVTHMGYKIELIEGLGLVVEKYKY